MPKKLTRLALMEKKVLHLENKLSDFVDGRNSLENKIKRIEEWLGEDWLGEEKEPESRAVMDEVSDFGGRLKVIEEELGIDPNADDEDDGDVEEEEEYLGEHAPKKKKPNR